jgi:hypothetical protein
MKIGEEAPRPKEIQRGPQAEAPPSTASYSNRSYFIH